MRILYLDCGMGVAGDMLQGALVSLFSKEEQESFISEINNIGLDDIEVVLKDDIKCGITGSHVYVKIAGEEEHSHDSHEDGHHHIHHEHEHEHSHEHEHCHDHNHEHHHEHEHSHSHSHHHTSMHDIEHMTSHLHVSDKVKEDVINIYKSIAEAESKVHGKPVSEVHFHEVGMKDAIIDITGVAMLMEKLRADKIICSPINVGYGKVKCAHGILPVPAPATAEIIKGIPTYAGRFEGEMCTPTGAAIIKYYADTFAYQPVMNIENSGYGCGNKEFEAANVVKAVIGTDAAIENGSANTDRVIELRCNIDDMTGEELSYAVEVLFENGVNDAFVTPIIMKKGRPGHLLTVLCREADKDIVAKLIFKHTTTIGIRQCLMDRIVLERDKEVINTELGDVSIKKSHGYGVSIMKAEFDELKRLAKENDMSIREVREIVNKSVH